MALELQDCPSQGEKNSNSKPDRKSEANSDVRFTAVRSSFRPDTARISELGRGMHHHYTMSNACQQPGWSAMDSPKSLSCAPTSLIIDLRPQQSWFIWYSLERWLQRVVTNRRHLICVIKFIDLRSPSFDGSDQAENDQAERSIDPWGDPNDPGYIHAGRSLRKHGRGVCLAIHYVYEIQGVANATSQPVLHDHILHLTSSKREFLSSSLHALFSLINIPSNLCFKVIDFWHCSIVQ
jgi:hypothetical protein